MIKVQASVTGSSLVASSTFTLKITQTIPLIAPEEYIIYPNLGPPYFQPSLIDLKINQGEFFHFKFPEIKDPDPNDDPIFVSLEGPSLMTGKFPNMFLKPASEHKGIFPVTVTLKDNNKISLSASYSFNIIVNSTGIQTHTNYS